MNNMDIKKEELIKTLSRVNIYIGSSEWSKSKVIKCFMTCKLDLIEDSWRIDTYSREYSNTSGVGK